MRSKRLLPDYMLPNAFVTCCPRCRRNTNGKVDRAQLPSPTISSESGAHSTAAETEHYIRAHPT